MANVHSLDGRFVLVAEELLDGAEDIEGDDPAEAQEARDRAGEWKRMAGWLLEHADKLPPVPNVYDTLDLAGATGSEIGLDR